MGTSRPYDDWLIMNESITSDSLSHVAGYPEFFNIETTLLLCIFSCLIGVLVGRKTSGLQRNSAKNLGGGQRREKQDVDYGNVIDSAFEARPFAKKLKVLCHPDRYAGNESKQKLAEALHQEVEENSHNLKELKLLEVRIKTELIDP